MKKLKLSFNSPAIMLYAFLCICAFVLHGYTGGVSTNTFFSVSHSSNIGLMTLARIFFHICGYIDLETLIIEMLVLLAIGPMVEEKYSSQKIIVVILAVGLLSSMPIFLWLTDAYLIGGKGVIAALLVLGSFTGDRDGSIPFSFLAIMVILIGYEGYQIYMSPENTQTLATAIEGLVGTGVGALFVKSRS